MLKALCDSKVVVIVSLGELDAFLMQALRADCFSFWISRLGGNYPSMHVMCKEDFVAIHFFANENHPGYRPSGNLGNVFGAEYIRFVDETGQEMELWSNSVIDRQLLRRAMRDFFLSPDLPKSIIWQEL